MQEIDLFNHRFDEDRLVKAKSITLIVCTLLKHYLEERKDCHFGKSKNYHYSEFLFPES